MADQKSRDELLESINWHKPPTGSHVGRCNSCGHRRTGTPYCAVLTRDTDLDATCDQHTVLPDLAE